MNERQDADVRDQIGTENGQYPPTKFIKIEVEARLILTVPSLKENEQVEDVILAVEQFINKLAGFNRAETGTAIGVRIHTHDYKTIK